MSSPLCTSLSLRLPIPDIINWPSSVFSQHFIHTRFENESHFSVVISLHICLLVVLSSGWGNIYLQGCSKTTQLHCIRASSRCMSPKKETVISRVASVENLLTKMWSWLSSKCFKWETGVYIMVKTELTSLSWNIASLSQADIRAAWHIPGIAGAVVWL